MAKRNLKTNNEYEEIFNKYFSKLLKKCPECGWPSEQRSSSNPNLMRCKNIGKKHCFNLLKETPFIKSKIQQYERVKIYDCWINGLRNSHIAWITGKTKKVINHILGKLAEFIVSRFYNSGIKIGGPNIVVEVDESKFGKRKYHRGRSVDGVWVLGIFERTPARRMILVAVKDRKEETLVNLLKKYVDQRSIIYTDCFKSYANLSNIFAMHGAVNHSQFFVDPATSIHTNTIEGNWCGIKMHVPLRNRTKKLVSLQLLKVMIRRLSPEDSLGFIMNLLK